MLILFLLDYQKKLLVMKWIYEIKKFIANFNHWNPEELELPAWFMIINKDVCDMDHNLHICL